MDGRKNNGGRRKGQGRKKGIGMSFDIKRYCDNMITEMLMDDAIRLKATKQLSLTLDTVEEDYLYIIENKGVCKIGYSSNFKKRLNNYKTHLGDVNLVYLTKQYNCFKLEGELHQSFEHKRMSGEWFDLDVDDILEAIEYCSKQLI